MVSSSVDDGIDAVARTAKLMVMGMNGDNKWINIPASEDFAQAKAVKPRPPTTPIKG